MMLASMLLSLMTAATLSIPPHLVLSGPVDIQSPLPLNTSSGGGGGGEQHHIPSRYESTLLARRLLALSSFGVISTIFPPSSAPSFPSSSSSKSPRSGPSPDTWSPHPPSVGDLPIALPDYLAACDDSSGNPTLLLLSPSTTSRNTLHGPHHNISLSLSWWESYGRLTRDRRPAHHYSPASLPRLSLIGYPEDIPVQEAEKGGVVDCFLSVHPDASWWLPGDKEAAHEGRWARLVVREIYWVGGFGDRAFIGWLNREEWEGVGEKEWRGVRLPGEDDAGEAG